MAPACERGIQILMQQPSPMPSQDSSTVADKVLPTQRRWHRLAKVLGTASLLLAVTGAGLWSWSGSEGSLASALRLTRSALPQDQQLTTHEVRGSLRKGGHIGEAVWQQPGLTVTAKAIELRVDMRRLLKGQLPLQSLQMASLSVNDQRAQTPPAPFTQLLWPLTVDLQWEIGTLSWPSSMRADALQGQYRFDGQMHHLHLTSLQWARGLYSGQAKMQARSPMPLEAALHAELSPLTPTGRALPSLQAEAQVHGHLAGQDAVLNLEAHLQQATGQGPLLDLQGQLRPQASPSLISLQARMQHMDLALFWPSAPHTQLDGQVQVTPQAAGWRLEAQLDNRLTGSWDQGRIPLQRLQAQLHYEGQAWQIHQLQAQWPGGGLQGQGQWRPDHREGQWWVRNLQPRQWWSNLGGPAISGQLAVAQASHGEVVLQTQLRPDTPGQREDRPPSNTTGLSAEIRQQGSNWQLSALDLDWMDMRLQAKGMWNAQERRLQVQGRWNLPGLQGHIDGFVSPSQGQGQWQLDGHGLAQLKRWLQRWPVLAHRLPEGPLPATLQARGEWQGGWADSGLVLQASARAPQWTLQGQGVLRQPARTGDWEGQVRQLDIQPFFATAPDPLALSLGSPLDWRWQSSTSQLDWQRHHWRLQDTQTQVPVEMAPGHWQSRRTGTGLPAARLLARASDIPARWGVWLGLPEPQGDMRLQAELDLDGMEKPRFLARLERSGGDLQVRLGGAQQPPVPAGVRAARAQLQLQGGEVRFDAAWDSARAGQATAWLESPIAADPGAGLSGLWPANAPLTGQVKALLPQIGVWSWLAPPGWRVQGSLDAQAEISGTRQQPRWNGRLQADDLWVRSAVEGVEFRQGRLRARLQEQQMLLDEFELQGAGAQGGSVSAQGLMRWSASEPIAFDAVEMDLQMQAKGLRVTNRADRRLSVSGQANARLHKGQMQLRGTLQADAAQFILPDDSTPVLDKDVVIVQPATAAPAPTAAEGLSVMGVPDVQVLLRLGPDFRLRGQGIDTRLAGEVLLTSNPSTQGQPRLQGEVRTEGGRYKAYGQQLDIDKGLLRFSGPYDNPALDILALRPHLTERVGVRITGTALVPRIRLYSDPEMPDADKLAWLLLGRSPAAGGTESAMLQHAALALLGGHGKNPGGDLLGSLGLDSVSLTNRTTTTASGSTATSTAVMLGKRLSKDFYVAFESSVSGAFGNLFIFYDLSRKLALRAQAGETNALDLIYTVRKD